MLLLLAGCPPAGDDDDTPRQVLLDDDDTPSGDVDEGGTPVAVPADSEFLSVCAAQEPDDAPIAEGQTVVGLPPWEGSRDCGVVPAGSGPLLLVRGRLDHVVDGSWDGDNDTVRFVTATERSPRVTVQWDPLRGDLDARLFCLEGATWRDVADGGLATSARPEVVPTTATMAAGAECALFVVSYEGPVVDWVAWLQTD